MKSHGRQVAVCLLLSLVSAAPGITSAQSPSAASPRAERPAGHFFGVMGHVVRPGVYEYAHAYPLLAEVVWHAGGATPHANGNIRVIRDKKVFYSPNANTRLRPGDIVIADGTEVFATRLAPAPAAAPAKASSKAAAKGAPASQSGGHSVQPQTADRVQIACVGLLDRPVVIPMPREQATVEHIVSALGQPDHAAQGVRILQTAGTEDASSAMTNRTLPDGAVLIFDPAQIQVEQLPNLPHTYQIQVQPAAVPEAPYHRQTGSREGADSAAAVAATVSSLPTSMKELPSVTEAAAAALPQPPAMFPTDDSSSDLSKVFDRLPVAGKSRAMGAAEIAPVAQSQSAAPASPARTSPSKASDPATTAIKSSFDWTLVLITLGSLAAVAGTAGAWIRFRRSEAHPEIIRFPETEPAQPEQRQRNRLNLLDALINDELPLTEEPCAPQPGLQFYGRPTGSRRLRIQPEHADAGLGGPHFAMPAAASTTPPAQPMREGLRLRTDAAHETEQRHQTVAATVASEFEAALDHDIDADSDLAEDRRASLLDRVLSHIHGSGTPA